MQSASQTPQSSARAREGQPCPHPHLPGRRRPLRHLQCQKPGSWVQCPQGPPRLQLIPRASGCILLISAYFPMVGGGSKDRGGQRCHIWPVILPQVSGQERENTTPAQRICRCLPPSMETQQAPNQAHVPKASRLPDVCLHLHRIQSSTPSPSRLAQPFL